MTHTFGAPTARLVLPFWAWPLAALVGLLAAAASLSYAPEGRLNVLWLWWLWAGLPLLGALIALLLMLVRRDRPWLFRWRQQHWFPDRAQRWHMLYRLHLLWLVFGAGLLAGFGVLLLFTDLAFGWSSTLLGPQNLPVGLFHALSWPWAQFWPAAVPDAALLESTRYVRIAPEPRSGAIERAGDWWPFLVASLITYNLIPRTLLALFSAILWRRSRRVAHPVPVVLGPTSSDDQAPVHSISAEADPHRWQAARVLNWEVPAPDGVTLGASVWRDDEHTLQRLLAARPERLLWRVPANRSPVGELADLIEQARGSGVAEQGLQVRPDTHTVPERHLASWQHFANERGLAWVPAP